MLKRHTICPVPPAGRSELNMANSTLESLFRDDPKHRETGRAAFCAAVMRLSSNRSRKGEPALKPRKGETKVEEHRPEILFI